MKATRRGYTLLFAVVAISLAGLAILLLARAGTNLTFEGNRMYREACVRNLLASGKAWAQAQIARGGVEAERTVELDAAALGVTGGTLKVTAVPAGEIRIEAMCRRGGQTLRKEAAFAMPGLPRRRPGPPTIPTSRQRRLDQAS